jgi:hypothetical protein
MPIVSLACSKVKTAGRFQTEAAGLDFLSSTRYRSHLMAFKQIAAKVGQPDEVDPVSKICQNLASNLGHDIL